jgi:hypothetical protein
MKNKIIDFKTDKNTINRLYEIAFVSILDNLTIGVGNDKLDYFLEHFTKVFDIDFTSIGIVKNMYALRMQPTKREMALFQVITKSPIKLSPIDYRTQLKYRKEWALNGTPQLQPHIVNEFLKPAIKKFVDNYIKLMFNDLAFIKVIGGLNDENGHS